MSNVGCAGCAEAEPFGTHLWARTQVGPLPVCGSHVQWALDKLCRSAPPAEPLVVELRQEPPEDPDGPCDCCQPEPWSPYPAPQVEQPEPEGGV